MSGTFVVEIPGDATEEQWGAINQAMEAIQEAQNDEITKVALQFGVPEGVASDVWYLRTRSRWSQKLENELIRLWKEEGKTVNIFEWP